MKKSSFFLFLLSFSHSIVDHVTGSNPDDNVSKKKVESTTDEIFDTELTTDEIFDTEKTRQNFLDKNKSLYESFIQDQGLVDKDILRFLEKYNKKVCEEMIILHCDETSRIKEKVVENEMKWQRKLIDLEKQLSTHVQWSEIKDKEQEREIDNLKGTKARQSAEIAKLIEGQSWFTPSSLASIALTLACAGFLYKWFLKDWFFPPKKEELYFNFVEAVAARNRGEYYVPPKPESKMTPEEKKARDLKLAKEKAEMEERKKREEIEKAQEKARDDRLARWDKLSDEAEELDLQKFERLHQERKEREIAEKKAREEAEKKEKERQEKEKREQEEEEKRKRVEEKRIEDAIARSIKEDEEKRKRWFSGILG